MLGDKLLWRQDFGSSNSVMKFGKFRHLGKCQKSLPNFEPSLAKLFAIAQVFIVVNSQR